VGGHLNHFGVGRVETELAELSERLHVFLLLEDVLASLSKEEVAKHFEGN